MNISKKIKSYALIGGLVGITVLGSTSFALNKQVDNRDNSQLINQARQVDANGISLSGFGDNGSLFNSVIKDSDNNYIAISKTNIIKLDTFTKPLYALDLSDDFSGYEVKQIVADYTTANNISNKNTKEPRVYYALVVNKDVNIHVKRVGASVDNRDSTRKGSLNDQSKLAIGGVDNPAHVIRIVDDGTKFIFKKENEGEIVNDFILDAPILPKNLNSEWFNLYIQRNILPNDVNTLVLPSPVGRVSGNGMENTDSKYDFGNGVAATDQSLSKLNGVMNSGSNNDPNTGKSDSAENVKKLVKTSFQLDEKFVYPEWTGNEKNDNITRKNQNNAATQNDFNVPVAPNVSLKEDTINVFSRLYLNSVNSLSFIGDSIYIFGSAELPSLWYYAFPTKLTDLNDLNTAKSEDAEKSNTDTGQIDNNNLKTYRSFGIESKPTSSNKIDETNWADPNVIEARIYSDYKLGISGEFTTFNSFINGSRGGVSFTSTGSRVILRASYDANKKPDGNFQPYLYVFGYQNYQQTRYSANGWAGNYKLIYASDYNLIDAAIVGTETNQNKSKTLNFRIIGGYLNEDGARSFSKTPYISEDASNRNIFKSGYSDNTYEYDQSILGYDGIRNNLDAGIKATSFVSLNKPDANGLESVAAVTYLRAQIGLAKISGNNANLPFGDKHQIITSTPTDTFSSIKNIKKITPGEDLWYFLFTDENKKSSVYTLKLPESDNLDLSSSFGPTSLVDQKEINLILPLLKDSLYTIDNSGKVSLYTSNKDSPGDFNKTDTFNSNLEEIAFSGSGSKYTSDFWGTIEFKPAEYLIKNGFTSDVAKNFVTNESFLNSLVNFTPGNAGKNYRVIVDPNGDLTNQKLPIKVQVQYLDGKYYDAKLKGQGYVTFSYNNFASLPSWVLPTAIGSTLGILAIMIILGLSIGIPMRAQRKLQDKGFKTTFKKVDTLTSAVGSVYKKIISQTANVKKKPAALGAAKTPAKPGEKPAAPKPAGAAPAKPAGPAKPSGPAKPAAPKPAAPKK
ncbi:hypothetical protein [Mycoplasma bradburyae]|uniref:hypothetical protein n=1 Tax=Mycoplasma bradburyae TaxID=2963128 RepID=UPI002340A03D|nr:hypothetical protein [Mycoplasma bradburyae]MDC4182907.1 cytadherence protein A [Mycoplasma bradburyae]